LHTCSWHPTHYFLPQLKAVAAICVLSRAVTNQEDTHRRLPSLLGQYRATRLRLLYPIRSISFSLPVPCYRHSFIHTRPGWHRGDQNAEWLITCIAELEVCPRWNGQAGSRVKSGDYILVSETAPYLSLARKAVSDLFHHAISYGLRRTARRQRAMRKASVTRPDKQAAECQRS
jgi:hypothetical protein